VLSNIRYSGAMAECGGGFIARRHHMTVANRVFSGGPWRPLSASRDVTVDRKRRKSARGVAHAEAWRALQQRTRRHGEHCVRGGAVSAAWAVSTVCATVTEVQRTEVRLQEKVAGG